MDYKCGCWETSQQGPAVGHGASQPWKGDNPRFSPSERGKTSLRDFFFPQGGGGYWDEPPVMVCPLQTHPGSLVWAVPSKVQVAVGR